MKMLFLGIAALASCACATLNSTTVRTSNTSCKIGKVYQSVKGFAFELDNCTVPHPDVPTWDINAFYYTYAATASPNERDLVSAVAFAKASLSCVDVNYDDDAPQLSGKHTAPNLSNLNIMPFQTWSLSYAYKFISIAVRTCP